MRTEPTTSTGVSIETIRELVAYETQRVLSQRRHRPVKVQLDDGAYVPVRHHSTDAGADVRSPKDFTVPAKGRYFLESGVHVQLPEGTKLDIREKSGHHKNHGVVSIGLIDEGYSGSIGLIIENHGDTPVSFSVGDEVCQFVVTEVCYPDFELVDEVDGGERGDGAYGSTRR